MDLEQHIKENHNGSKRAFAKSISKTRTQVYRYLKDGCKWFEGDVWGNKTKLTQNKSVNKT